MGFQLEQISFRSAKRRAGYAIVGRKDRQYWCKVVRIFYIKDSKMGFFKKLAKGLGIGVANVTLEIPAIISKNVWELDGVVTISAESDLLVEKISIEIEETVAETRTQFSGENVYEESFKTKHNLGKTEIGENISMKAGEDQNISFKVPIVSPQFPPEPKQGIFSQSKPPQPSFKAKALVKFAGVIAEQEVSKTFKME